MAPPTPHNGITLEEALFPIRHILLKPFITANLLILTRFLPHLSTNIPTILLNIFFSPTSHLVLTTLLILSLILKSIYFLTDLFLNNFDFGFSSRFEHGKEIVVVTGGASGIGEAIVMELSGSVESMHVLDIQAPKIPFPDNTTLHPCDITNSSALSSAAKKIRKEHGEPTIVINNAALTYARPIISETAKQIERVLNVNLISHFLTVKEFLPSMVKANRGHIVTVAGMGSYSMQASNVDYDVSKAGVLAFHEGLAQELEFRYQAPKVRTSVIHPGNILTPAFLPYSSQPHYKNQLITSPQTVAKAVVRQLHSGKGGQVIVPWTILYWAVSGMRGWPGWMQEYARNTIGRDLEFLGDEGVRGWFERNGRGDSQSDQ